MRKSWSRKKMNFQRSILNWMASKMNSRNHWGNKKKCPQHLYKGPMTHSSCEIDVGLFAPVFAVHITSRQYTFHSLNNIRYGAHTIFTPLRIKVQYTFAPLRTGARYTAHACRCLALLEMMCFRRASYVLPPGLLKLKKNTILHKRRTVCRSPTACWWEYAVQCKSSAWFNRLAGICTCCEDP